MPGIPVPVGLAGFPLGLLLGLPLGLPDPGDRLLEDWLEDDEGAGRLAVRPFACNNKYCLEGKMQESFLNLDPMQGCANIDFA